MTTQLNSKLITLNCNRKQKRTLRQKGFTLIELMVVTAVAGVLGAVAIPKFLGARDIAEAKAQVAAAVGIGKECQTWIQTNGTGLKEAPETETGGPTVNCASSTAQGTVESVTFNPVPAKTIKCLTLDTSTSTADVTKATITVDTDGSATCLLS